MMDLRLVRHFVRQLARGKRFWGMAALSSVAGFIAWISSIDETDAEIVEIFHFVTATVAGATISIAFLVMGAATLRDERDAGTLPFIFMKPIPRWRWASSAWAAAALVAFAVGVVGWIVGFLAMGMSTGSWTLAIPALALYAAAAVGYTAVFVPIGYLFTRAILVGLAYVFVWEGIITTFVTGLSASSVWRTAMSIYADLTDLTGDALDTLGPVAPGVGGGILKLAGTVLVGVGVLTWALRRRDAL
jgi:ABC-type transport system involved in multi-copper enzyme maturation permease subunit